VSVGVNVNVGVDDGDWVGVFEGVIVAVGVLDNAIIICLASAVRATDVRVAFISLVGVGVLLGVCVGVNVNVGVFDGVCVGVFDGVIVNVGVDDGV